MAVITLSRQYASGGDEIAARLCELLDYRYFDKRLMVEVAAEVGLSQAEIVDFSEEKYKVRSFFSRLLRAGPGPIATVSVWQEDKTGTKTLNARQLDEEECVALVRHTVQIAYKQGNVVIVGRGGQAILRDKPDALHVRVIASIPSRIKRMQQRGVVGIADIKTTLAQQDRATAAYLKRFYDVQWDDLSLYDLVINTDKIDVETSAQIIASAVQHFQAAPTG